MKKMHGGGKKADSAKAGAKNNKPKKTGVLTNSPGKRAPKGQKSYFSK